MSTAIKALPFFGGTLSGFDPSDNNTVESTGGGTYDTNYATCSLSIGSSSSTGTSPTWPAASTFWCRFGFHLGIPVSGFPTFNAVNFYRSGTLVGKIEPGWSGGNGWNIGIWTLQSGVITNNGFFQWYPGGILFIDAMIVAGGSGSAALYSNNTLAYQSGTLNHSGFSGIDQVQFSGIISGSGGPAYFSEIICDTTSTVGRRLRTDRLNTNSAVNTGWTGSVTNINEIPTTDNSPLTAAASNLTSTFFENGLSLGNITVLARGVSARMKREDTNGPQHIAMVIRAGATNFPSTNIPASLGYSASFNSWTTNPHTNAGWTSTNASAAENGVKSLT